MICNVRIAQIMIFYARAHDTRVYAHNTHVYAQMRVCLCV